MVDLVLLVADKNAQFALRGALKRPQSLGIRPVTFECIVHPFRDGGARTSGPDILRLKRNAARHALLVFDCEGCGEEDDASTLEARLDARLQEDWGDRAKTIVIEPEVDVWIWGSDNALETEMRWRDLLRLRAWLQQSGYVFQESGKPERPKEALECALRHARKPRSSAFYEQIAARISLQGCLDPAFGRLRECLQLWFPAVAYGGELQE